MQTLTDFFPNVLHNLTGSVPGQGPAKAQKLYGRDRLERQQLIIRELVTMLSIAPNKQMTVVRLCKLLLTFAEIYLLLQFLLK